MKHKEFFLSFLMLVSVGITQIQAISSVFQILPKPQHIEELKGKGISGTDLQFIVNQSSGEMPVLGPILNALPQAEMQGKGVYLTITDKDVPESEEVKRISHSGGICTMTKQEALFRAIGQLEESQLAQTEHTMLNLSHAQEDENMDKKKCKRRILPNILVAVLIVTMLATTAFAAVGYLLFDTPIQMIQALFGNETGYDEVNWSVEGNSGETYAYSADRTPVDESVAKENLEPLVEPVGQSITYAGHTLTVDANGYDAATKCGFVTYTIENPDGLRPYQVQANGEVWFPLGELLTTNQYGRSYILKDKSTDTKLCATYYYQIRNPQTEDLELRLSFWAAIEDPEAFMALPPEEAVQMNVSDSEDAIVISTANSASLETATFGNGAVTVSTIALQVDLSLAGDRDFVDTLKILFRDGTEYIIQDDGTINSLFNVGSSDGSEVTFMMNRLVDVDQIASVIVNDVQLVPDE